VRAPPAQAAHARPVDVSETALDHLSVDEFLRPVDVSETALDHLSADEFLRCFWATMPDGLIVTDRHGRILSLNRAAEIMFGFREREMLGENVSTLMLSPHRARHDGYIRHFRDSQRRTAMGRGRLVTARRRNGDHFPIDIVIGQAMLKGKMVFTAFIRDLSEREDARKRLQVLQAELAQVSRITSMGMLAGAIAHELNQPLAAIANYSETVLAMIREGQHDLDVIGNAMDQCTREVMRAGEVIRRLRGFLARGEIECSRASLKEMIGDAVALALADGEGAGVSLALDHDPEADLVFADRVEVQQVVLNLVRNAKEAMTGQPEPAISVVTRRSSQDHAEVVIADSGPGIEPRFAHRLFQPFHSTKPGGMGIGLSICHVLVEGLGGRIWVEPSALGGAAFHFTLPLMKETLQNSES
jgi:two-component system, LuxR family, sensor kinase FixL